MSDPIEDMILKQNWRIKFREALKEYTIAANILNFTVKDGIIMFGKEATDIMCADEKNKVIAELKEVQQSRGTNGRTLEGGSLDVV